MMCMIVVEETTLMKLTLRFYVCSFEIVQARCGSMAWRIRLRYNVHKISVYKVNLSLNSDSSDLLTLRFIVIFQPIEFFFTVDSLCYLVQDHR